MGWNNYIKWKIIKYYKYSKFIWIYLFGTFKRKKYNIWKKIYFIILFILLFIFIFKTIKNNKIIFKKCIFFYSFSHFIFVGQTHLLLPTFPPI